MEKIFLFFKGLKHLTLCTLKIFLTNDLNKQTKILNYYSRKVFEIFSIPVQVKGLEKIEKLPPSILVSNHFSSLDIPLILGFIPRKIRMAAKAELLKVPFVGWIIKKAKFVPIQREDFKKAIKQLEIADWLFKNGFDLYMAPEGTRSLNGNVRDFKKGPFVLGIKHKVPIIPITIFNTDKAMPKGYIMPKRKIPVGLLVHEPVFTDGYDYEKRGELKELVRNIIISGFNELNFGR